MTYAELRQAGYKLDEAAYRRLSQFVERLLEKNRQLNLISRSSANRVWTAHVCDSLAVLPLMDAARPRRLVDVGSGGGLPGAVLACARPDVHVTLIEATRKKITAVQEILSQAQIGNVSCVWGRAEQLGQQKEFSGQFDAMTARAVGPLCDLLAYAALLLRPGGLAWLYKTPQRLAGEQKPAERVARRLGLRHVENRTYRLPVENAARVIVTYQKNGSRT